MKAMIFATVLAIAGCATDYSAPVLAPVAVSESGQAFDMALSEQFVKGVTTRADVERVYGKPGTVMDIGQSTIIGYNYMAVIGGKPGLVYGQALLLTFGPDGLLADIGRSKSNIPIR